MSVDRPVTFRDVFAVSEYRAVWFALVASWIGDYLARAVVVVLVFRQTESVTLSAVAFAVTYVPWLLFGTVLSALAERHTYRGVMVLCDLARMVVIALLLMPGVQWPAVLAVTFLVTLGGVPIQAARSALMPMLLDRRRLAVAMAANATTVQAAQVAGYLTGATLAAAANPQLAIAIVVVLFGTSALVIRTHVRPRPPAVSQGQRSHLLRETAAGFKLVFGSRVLRSIALMVFAMAAFAIVPEGLAAGWAAHSGHDSVTRGIDQGLIMAAGPVGFVIGGLAVGRLVSQETRHRLIRPFAVLAPLVLVPALVAPPVPVVVLLTMLSGVAQGGLMPTLNTQFVLTLPHGYRARAFGVVQQGLQVCQGGAVLVTGVLAERSSVPLVVGVWSVAGVLSMLLLAGRWPRTRTAEPGAAEPSTAEPMPEPLPPARGSGRWLAGWTGDRTTRPASDPGSSRLL